jgi:integrase
MITVERFLSNWWQGESKELKASTRTVDKRIIFNQIIPQFGQLSLTDLKRHQIRDWVRAYGIVMP